MSFSFRACHQIQTVHCQQHFKGKNFSMLSFLVFNNVSLESVFKMKAFGTGCALSVKSIKTILVPPGIEPGTFCV